MKKYSLLFCLVWGMVFISNISTVFANGTDPVAPSASAVDAASVSYDKLIVYGSSSCSFTSMLRTFLVEHGVQYTFKDIDIHAGAQNEMWAIVNNASWYGGGSVSLPVVEVNGTAFERPDHTAVLALLGTGNGLVSSEDTGSFVGEVKIGMDEAVEAEINLVRISSIEEFWQICTSNEQGSFSCHGIKPGEYRIVIRRNTSIDDASFLNSFVQSGKIFSITAKETINAGLTIVKDLQIEVDYILPLSYPQELYWGNPTTKEHNYLYLLTSYGTLWGVNTSDSTYDFLFDDSGYMNDLKYSPTKKVVATLSQTNRKMYVVDVNPLSATFHSVLQVIENLPSQPTNLVFNSSGDMAYVGCNGGKSVAVLNLNSGTLAATIGLSGYTQDVVLDEPRNRAYAGVYSGLLVPNNQLAVIDIDPASPTYHTVLKYIPIGNNGSFTQYSMYPYVYSASERGIDRIDVTSDAVETIIHTNTVPPFTISREKSFLYYIDYDDAIRKNYQLKVFDLNLGSIIQEEYLPTGPTYYRISLADDESSVIVSSNTQKVYSFPIKVDGTLDDFNIPGDVNHDDVVDPTDAVLTLQILAGIEPSQPVFKDADVNQDGRIGSEEVIIILRKAAGL